MPTIFFAVSCIYYIGKKLLRASMKMERAQDLGISTYKMFKIVKLDNITEGLDETG